jgi:hypothetical protein
MFPQKVHISCNCEVAIIRNNTCTVISSCILSFIVFNGCKLGYKSGEYYEVILRNAVKCSCISSIDIQCGNFVSKIFLEFSTSANQGKKKKLKPCSLFLELVFENF